MKRKCHLWTIVLLIVLWIITFPISSFAADTSYASEGWSNELSITLSDACDWLSDTDDDMLLQFCLGSAGKTAPPGTVNHLVQKIAKTDPDSMDLCTLSYNILNVTFSGYHAANVMGVNLIDQLTMRSDFTATDLYPIAYGLLSLSSNPYEVTSILKNSPSRLVERLLQYQNSDGGFRSSYLKADSSAVQTGLALAALANYRDQEGVNSSIRRGLAYLSANQQWDGSFLENNVSSSLAVSKTIVALKALGIPLNDPRFVKNDETLIGVLLRYVRVDGGFSLVLDEDSDVSATENAILALAAIKKTKSPYLMDTPLAESTYVEEAPVVLEPAGLSFDWTIPFFFGLYVLLFVLVIIYLILSRLHPLLYWEKYTNERNLQTTEKFRRAAPVYEEPKDETH